MSVKRNRQKLTDEPPWHPEGSSSHLPKSKDQLDLIKDAEFGRGMQAGLRKDFYNTRMTHTA